MDIIETEITKALKIKLKKGEENQAYLSRIVVAVQNIDNDVWEGLSPPTQRWANAAAKAYDAKKEIPGFDDAATAPAPKAKASAKSNGKPPAAKAPKEKKEPKEKTVKPPSMYKTLKAMVIADPETTTEKLAEKLTKAGFMNPKMTTIQTCRADTRDTIRALQDAGRLKQPMLS